MWDTSNDGDDSGSHAGVSTLRGSSSGRSIDGNSVEATGTASAAINADTHSTCRADAEVRRIATETIPAERRTIVALRRMPSSEFISTLSGEPSGSEFR